MAAIAGTAGEIVFALLLIVGLSGRYAAAGLFVVNIVDVVSCSQFLLGEGFEAALGQHCLWGFVLLALVVFGPGRLALDSAGPRNRA